MIRVTYAWRHDRGRCTLKGEHRDVGAAGEVSALFHSHKHALDSMCAWNNDPCGCWSYLVKKVKTVYIPPAASH